jgi:glycerol-3-phosphate dehydrogenase subunit B
MTEILVIGGGPAGLLAAFQVRLRGARVRVVAAGIGTSHIMPGWLSVLDTEDDLPSALERWTASHPEHPYALTGLEALHTGVASFRELAAGAGLSYVGELKANFQLPTALGAIIRAALVPESFVAGDISSAGPMLIAGPAGWRDFYPKLCAANLARQGIPAASTTFELSEHQRGKFDLTSVGLARLFDRAEVRARVADQLRARLDGATRVGFPAVLGLEQSNLAWNDLQDRLGVQVFEIPTLPPSVPGMRLYNAFKRALSRARVQVLLDMTATRGVVEGSRALGIVVPNVVREASYRADEVILATGGLYGGGISTDHRGGMREVIFDLPVAVTGAKGGWFNERLLSDRGHPIHSAGVRANRELQPVDEAGRVILENVRVAGRLLAGYDPVQEGSTEGVWLATASRAAFCAE